MTGDKYLTETDYVDGSARGELTFQRTYHSLQTLAGGYPAWRAGWGWRHTFDRSVQVLGDATLTQAFVTRGDGRLVIFTYQSSTGTFVGDPDDPEVFRNAPGGSGATYQFVDANDTVENYDADGKLLSITTRGGFVTALSYDANGRLMSVTASSGRSLQFNYTDPNDVTFSSVTFPDGQSIAYTYQAQTQDYIQYEELTHVAYPSNGYTDYTYAQSANLRGALLTDVLHNGAAYTHYTYAASSGTQISSTSLVAANATFGNFLYSQNGNTLTTSFTTPFGQSETYNATIMFNKVKLISTSGPCPLCGVGNISAESYDAFGYPLTKTDFNGVVTNYIFDDTRGMETQRAEGSGASRRTINTTPDPNFRLPDQRSVINSNGVTEALTKWAYNTRGQATARCVIDPAVSGASSYNCGTSSNAPTGVRQWTYTYCDSVGTGCPVIGLLKTVDGPRVDVSDVTTYAYYQTTDETGCATLGGTCHRLGDLQKVTNALSQATTYVSYDKNGRVTRMQDANNTYTDMTYHARGWLLTRTVRGNANGTPNASSDATTSFAYDNVGNVTQVTQPDGTYLHYVYDNAHRLTDIYDSLVPSNYLQGNHIHYTLDAAGNRTTEDTKDSSGAIKRTVSRQYDQLNRFLKTLNASSATVQQYQNPIEAPPSGITYNDGYDGNGNSIYSLDGNGVGTEQQYDSLNRLVKTLQDHAGTGATHDTMTQYAYDTRDNLRSVVDPDNLTTSYTYDGMNDLTSQQSPDTGSTSYTYDAAGNRKTQTDARGVIATYSYDALNRLTGISYPTDRLNVYYIYDQPSTGCYNVGRLTTMTDSSGSTTYCYDRRGNVLKKTQVVPIPGSPDCNDNQCLDGSGGPTSASLTTTNTYTLADRLASITYPSNAIVTYGRDTVGRIVSVSLGRSPGPVVSVVSNISYYPFGPVNTLTFGNGRVLTKTYDQDYAIDKVVSSSASGLIVDATVDALGNVKDASSSVSANPPTQKYQYDPLYRLQEIDSGTNSPLEVFTYDKTGDRLSKTITGQSTQTYAYTPGTHRLSSVGGVNRLYDPNGNTADDGVNIYGFDDRNRLADNGSTSYDYNGRGERTKKSPPDVGLGSIFMYDESGRLLSEYGFSVPGCDPDMNCYVTYLMPVADYIYVDGTPVAYAPFHGLDYIETDQLGTPRQVIQPGTTTANDTVVWKWDYFANNSAFGENAPSVQTITFNLRFPGQYYDAETGLNYNYFRDYEPGTGRYVESDPLGLSGGIDTYAYGADAPLYLTDRLGLSPCGGDCCKNHPWRQGNGEFASGGVECCGGKMVPCVNPKICEGKDQSGKPVAYPSDACKIVTDCARKHEQFHIDNGHPASCSGDGTPPFQPPFDNGSGECAAYRNEVPCLNISKCTSHLCEDIIKQVQSFKILNRQKFCNAAGM